MSYSVDEAVVSNPVVHLIGGYKVDSNFIGNRPFPTWEILRKNDNDLSSQKVLGCQAAFAEDITLVKRPCNSTSVCQQRVKSICQRKRFLRCAASLNAANGIRQVLFQPCNSRGFRDRQLQALVSQIASQFAKACQ